MEEKQRLTDPDPEGEQEQAPIDRVSLPVLHLYRTQGGLLFLPDEAVREQEEREAIESAPFDLDRERADTHPRREPQGTHQPPEAKVGTLIIALVLLVNVAILLSAILATLLQTVTIVIVPKTQQITEHLTLVSLQSRVFSPLTVTQTKTVPATGHGYQPATQAHGILTFYNALQQSQYLPSGTLVTSSNGVNIVTAQDATVPAGDGMTNGSVQVPAYAINPGAQGNIAAYALNGTCCREYILVKNLTVFVGGQDARAYQTVTQADIHGAVSSLLPTITQAIATSFAKQVRPNETLTPLSCSQTQTADHGLGEEAQHVTVTLGKTCRTAAYTTSTLQTTIMRVLSEREPGYKLKAYLQVAPLSALLHENRVSVSATFQAVYRYTVTQAETDKVLSEIQGKQTHQVARFLEQLPGVEHITITALANQDTVPTDKTYIHLLIVEG